ncbi:hypothetical protein Agub_g153 [Astrephomene gubernaculifera]|uniref:Uncharacterized protein n=1 Tax=Astrephomene gubernaculifera TaxID=47775 RepID=A0AAD3HGG4_9CHLO|nr:hypothetical protein Agub_g153 [Astrephomene gubernaculifera]
MLASSTRFCLFGHAPAVCAPLTRPRVAKQALICKAARDRDGHQRNDGATALPYVLATLELSKCSDIFELESTYNSNELFIDAISLAAAWVKLGKLYNAKVDACKYKQVTRNLLSKALKLVEEMDLRQISNVLWAMGKMRLDLAAEPLGPYLVEQMEGRLLVVLEEEGLSDPRSAEQLWFGLALCKYDWSGEVLRALLHQTLEAIRQWENCKAVSQVCQQLSTTLRQRVTLDDQQRALLAGAIASAIHADDKDPQIKIGLAKAVGSFLLAADLLQLPVTLHDVQRMNDITVNMPPGLVASEGGLLAAYKLLRCTRLGFQPSQADAQRWYLLLTEGARAPWDAYTVSWIAASLASCRNFKPPPELVQHIGAVVRSPPRGVEEGDLSRLVTACKAWGVKVPDTVASRLSSRSRPAPQ